MTHDERISSYIDNELSLEQEQEFLISLAASDGLRKSFRSELVLKNVMHRDDASVNPPHTLRRSVFAALGLAGADMVASEHAHAASQSAPHALKALFASKMSTLIVAGGIGVSAMAGYGLHSVVSSPASVAPLPAAVQVAPSVAPLAKTETVVAPLKQVENLHQHAATVTHRTHPRVNLADVPKAKTDPVSGAAGGGSIIADPPKIGGK